MKNRHKGGWSILIITVLCIGLIYFFGTFEKNKEIRIYKEQKPDVSSSAGETAKESYVNTVNSYPYYGMSEEDLNHCLLGKPFVVSECSNFDNRAPKDRIKYYYFGYSANDKNAGKIIVRYRFFKSQENDYVDLPPENGYVDTGYYIDKEGVEYRIDSSGTSIVEEAAATTEEIKEKSGGRLLPGSKENGKGASSGTRKHKDTTEFDPDDHDIEAYYEDNMDEFDSYDDAYDAFEDDEDAWDDY